MVALEKMKKTREYRQLEVIYRIKRVNRYNMIQEKTNKQEFYRIKRLINKKIEGGKYSQLPLAHQIKTALPSVAVPGPLRS